MCDLTSTSQRLTRTFDALPDAPLGEVRVRLDGGPDSLLRNGWSMCFGSPTVKGTFAAHSGRTAAATAPVALTGCR